MPDPRYNKINNDVRLNPKLYARWDRVFMMFGSTMNGLQGQITDLEKVEEAWKWCKEKTKELIDELYAENEEEQPL